MYRHRAVIPTTQFWSSLQCKIPAVFVAFFLLILAAIFSVLSTVGKSSLEEQAYRQVLLSGQIIVSELGRRLALAESLATALANLGERLPPDDTFHKNLAKHIMNHEGTEAFIAGGGLWPAPYQYDPNVERRSFFWGRDAQGILQYYEDYNDPEGPGYHHEEWYVPAKHLKEGKAFWSRSYMDPYSYQPMVTVTVPMYRDGAFYGVSTIDLKLEGLHDFLKTASQSFGGYAFAVDRNGKFLSFPDEKATKIFGTDQQGKRTEEFRTVTEFASTHPRFKPLADAVQSAIDQTISRTQEAGTYDASLARKIAEDSYQIGDQEAQRIAAILSDFRDPDNKLQSEVKELSLDDDVIVGESAFAAVFQMPQTHWKIVTVMPYSKAIEAANTVYTNLVSYTLIAMFLSLIAILLLVRRILVRPITDMSTQLKLLSEDTTWENAPLMVSDRGELGRLAYWFNRRSQKLYAVQNELRAAREQLEHRVVERTEKLRLEIERREKDQSVREAQVARVEKQHAAIVELSLHEALYQGDIVKAAQMINEMAARTIDVERASIWLIDDQRACLESLDLYERGAGRHSQTEPLRIADHPTYFEALESDRSIAISDLFNDRRTSELREYAKTAGVCSLLDSPIRLGGKFRGVVCLEHVGEKRQWHEDEIRFSGELADQFIQALTNAERIRSEEQIRQLAFYDPLTELPNRRLLLENIQHEIEVATRHGTFGYLIFLDLDNFKMLNDSLGHHVGDDLLSQLSQRLRAKLRKKDTASRLAGDEFVVLISAEYSTKQQAMEQALTVAQKIQAAISTPYHLQGFEHVITSSMGITLYPETSKTATDVLKQADTAMYRSKEAGRNTISFYNPDMQKAATKRLSLEKELRAAIAAETFETFFQLQVDSNGDPIGAEALVRWHHPGNGIVSPAEFIPVAEETGLILDIGALVLRDACRLVRESSIQQVALNISPRQFRQPNFVDNVSRIVEESGAEPSSLMIELTEGVVIENIEDTIYKINDFMAMGISIAIDDFGTGYSSLAYLKRLPLDQLKISQDFVRDINTDPSDAIIVATTISMAKHLGLDVVAEGVETDAQLSFLTEKGCELFQGYYFGRPLPKSELLKALTPLRPSCTPGGQ